MTGQVDELARHVRRLGNHELNELLKDVMLQSHRWTFLHPDHPTRSTMPVPPPPGDRVGGLDKLAELARLMREAHEGPPTTQPEVP